MSGSDLRVDRFVRGVIEIFDGAFPGRIRACYLRGSRASGTATTGSDIDMFVVFKDAFADRAEAARAQRLCSGCALLCPILLEILVVSERLLHRDDNVVIALQLKFASEPVYGDDIRADLPDFDAETYVREVVHTPVHSFRFPDTRRTGQTQTYPLDHIDDTPPCYGYDQMLTPGPDGTDVPSTKLLVASVGWTATAIIAMRTGLYVRDKRACVELYRDHIADEWTELVVDVHELCRNRWGYLIPTADSDRVTLQSMCERALAFQNQYLDTYRRYLLAELRSEAPARQLLGAQRLGEIVFPDREILDALRELRVADGVDLRQAVAATLERYQHRETAHPRQAK